MTIIDKQTLKNHTIYAKDFVSCNQAFIDCRTPGSDQKENYSMIGPGVSQSSKQFVNLKTPHGFNIGAAAMPKGCVNNLHIHFTAEVFYLNSGEYEFRWGNAGEHTYCLTEGDVFSPRTWLFRGFRNVGRDDGFVFTVLGGDDTGGIIWHPDVLNEAKNHGLLLTAKNQVLDTVANPDINPQQELITPLTGEQLATLRQPSPEQMLKQVVHFKDLNWSDESLLCAKTNGGACAMAPVIGWGMSEYRDHTPKIYNPHGFSVEWLKIPTGNSVKLHRINENQVVKIHQGQVKITLNRPEDGEVSSTVAKKDIVSVPAKAWRTFTNVGSTDVYMLIINGSDSPNRIEWDKAIITEAIHAGYGLDKSGYMALYSLIKYSNPMI